MSTLEEDRKYIYYVGSTFTVEWYVDEPGRMQAKEYYDALSKDEQNRLDYVVRYFADSPIGTWLSKTLYNLEDAEHKIYAFKPKDHRFFNFMAFGRKVVIVNAYRKHSRQMSKKDLNLLKTAIRERNSYQHRIEEGTYYERLA